MHAETLMEQPPVMPTEQRILRHYPLEHKAGLQSVPMHKGATLHGVTMKEGMPHIVASAPPNAEMGIRDFLMLLSDGELPANHPYLGSIPTPEGSDKPNLHVFPCPE